MPIQWKPLKMGQNQSKWIKTHQNGSNSIENGQTQLKMYEFYPNGQKFVFSMDFVVFDEFQSIFDLLIDHLIRF